MGLSFLISFSSFAQIETYKWTFGNGVGLDFGSGGSPVTFSHSMTVNKVYESTSSVSDASGNILFYTNGYSVWSANGSVMSGGNQTLKVGLGGTNGSAVQGVTIVKNPFLTGIYYVFTTDAADDAGDYGFNYATVDMTQNSGLGSVSAITRLKDESGVNFNTTEMVGVVAHSNSTDIWIVTHVWKSGGSSKFLAYKLSNSGISTPVATSLGYNYTTKDEGRGSLAFSAGGTRAAVVHHHQNWPYTNALELYDFNNSTGVFSNLVTLGNTNWNNYASGYSAVFSPDGSKLYVSFITYQGIVQYDLTSWGTQATIKASETLISGSTSGEYGQMKIGPNGVLYKARLGASYVATITGNLNGSAASLTYTNNGLSLSPTGTSSYSMPNMFVRAANPLPVELVSFGAKLEGDYVRISWTIASAINNDYFSVEHSFDGITFNEIEKVNGVGNSNDFKMFSVNNYAFSELNYYRLKIVDYNGDYSYSKTVMVKTTLNKEISFLWNNQQCSISMNASENTMVEIFSTTGENKHKQNTVFSSANQTLVIPFSDLEAGVYFVRLSTPTEVLLSRNIVLVK